MILNFIMGLVFFYLFIELLWKKEGFDTDVPGMGINCEFDINIKYPMYDLNNNTYTNRNNYLYNNYQNIIKYASTPCNNIST